MIVRKNIKQIIADSIEDLMKRIPFEDITINDIVKNCGVSRQAFYNNFKDKYEALCWAYEQYEDMIIKRINDSYTWHQAALETLKFIESKKQFYFNAINTSGQNSFPIFGYERTLSDSISVIKKKHGISTIDHDLEFALKLYFHGVVAVTDEWILNGMKMSPELFAQNLMDCMPPLVRKYLL